MCMLIKNIYSILETLPRPLVFSQYSIQHLAHNIEAQQIFPDHIVNCEVC